MRDGGGIPPSRYMQVARKVIQAIAPGAGTSGQRESEEGCGLGLWPKGPGPNVSEPPELATVSGTLLHGRWQTVPGNTSSGRVTSQEARKGAGD